MTVLSVGCQRPISTYGVSLTLKEEASTPPQANTLSSILEK